MTFGRLTKEGAMCEVAEAVTEELRRLTSANPPLGPGEMKRLRERMCRCKIPFEDKSEAVKTIKHLSRCNGQQTMVTYRCPFCGCWHNGNPLQGREHYKRLHKRMKATLAVYDGDAFADRDLRTVRKAWSA